MKKSSLIVGNWKLNPGTLAEARKLLTATKKASGSFRGTLVVCPPVPFLADLSLSYRGSRIAFGAQDISSEMQGAFTGEYSALMVKSVKARFAIVGHSERRARGEGNELVGKKLTAALSAGLTPILCIGEKERDEHGEYFHFLESELRAAFAGVPEAALGKTIVAYEPIWAIGKKAENAMQPNDVHQMAIFIRKTLAQTYSRSAIDKVKILYGGSVEPSNVAGLLTDGGIDGLLVGHVSIEPARFAELLSIIQNL